MTINFRKAVFAAGISLAALLPAAPSAFAQEMTIVLNTNEVGAQSYNPIKAPMLNTATALIYDRLVEQDADLSFHPHLAESWEEAPDGMSWVFHLRKDVKFHNGEPFNAAFCQAVSADNISDDAAKGGASDDSAASRESLIRLGGRPLDRLGGRPLDARLIIAARALGLDCGPMSGFDPEKINAEFFPNGRWRTNFICNLGYGVKAGLHPRNPRLSFDQACVID